MADLGEELKHNAETFLNSAELVYSAKDWTSAAILYFKAIFAALDLRILNETGKAPKDHEERFRILQERYPDVYRILDGLWPIYRATYRTTISQMRCIEARKYAKEIISGQAA